jgi:hypothetical protein
VAAAQTGAVFVDVTSKLSRAQRAALFTNDRKALSPAGQELLGTRLAALLKTVPAASPAG